MLNYRLFNYFRRSGILPRMLQWPALLDIYSNRVLENDPTK